MPPRMLSYRLFTPADQAAVLDLIGRASYVHRHLDWQPGDAWLTDPEMVAGVGWRRAQAAALMAFSPTTVGVSWLRVVALDGDLPAQVVVRELWDFLRPALWKRGVRRICVLMLETWLYPSLALLGFVPVEEIVTLQRIWDDPEDFAIARPPGVTLRPAEATDLEAVLRIDHTAFEVRWQMRPRDLAIVREEALSFTLAEWEGQVAGYEISLRYDSGIHLARLATAPHRQGQGIGSALVAHVLYFANRLGISALTVNTQASNAASLHLYQRYGFRMIGEGFTVLEARLPDSPGMV